VVRRVAAALCITPHRRTIEGPPITIPATWTGTPGRASRPGRGLASSHHAGMAAAQPARARRCCPGSSGGANAAGLDPRSQARGTPRRRGTRRGRPGRCPCPASRATDQAGTGLAYSGRPRCQASSAAAVTGKTSAQRLRGARRASAASQARVLRAGARRDAGAADASAGQARPVRRQAGTGPAAKSCGDGDGVAAAAADCRGPGEGLLRIPIRPAGESVNLCEDSTARDRGQRRRLHSRCRRGRPQSRQAVTWPGLRRRSWPGRTSWRGWTASARTRPGSSSTRYRDWPRPRRRAWPAGSPARSGCWWKRDWQRSPGGCWGCCPRRGQRRWRGRSRSRVRAAASRRTGRSSAAGNSVPAVPLSAQTFESNWPNWSGVLQLRRRTDRIRYGPTYRVRADLGGPAGVVAALLGPQACRRGAARRPVRPGAPARPGRSSRDVRVRLPAVYVLCFIA